jgi:ankyrin repeat protein
MHVCLLAKLTFVCPPCISAGATFDLKNPADSSAFHAALDRGAASVASKLLQHLNKPKVNNKALPAPHHSNTSTTLSTTKVCECLRVCECGCR